MRAFSAHLNILCTILCKPLEKTRDLGGTFTRLLTTAQSLTAWLWHPIGRQGPWWFSATPAPRPTGFLFAQRQLSSVSNHMFFVQTGFAYSKDMLVANRHQGCPHVSCHRDQRSQVVHENNLLCEPPLRVSTKNVPQTVSLSQTSMSCDSLRRGRPPAE